MPSSAPSGTKAAAWTVSCADVPGVRRPGSSQFFVSLEDDLMRLFGSGRIASMMDRMGLKEGEVIQQA